VDFKVFEQKGLVFLPGDGVLGEIMLYNGGRRYSLLANRSMKCEVEIVCMMSEFA
jgi:hypothetical protein